ncbi:MAG: SDR family oxidoreductase [Myxococcales bacterium]|nr:SDR family oxidoreductase [Myxococcales bacterium]
MRLSIKGETVLLTGASAGIGTELARQMAPEAGTLILVARREDRLLALKDELEKKHKELRVLVRACDLTDQDALTGLLDSLEQEGEEIGILVNNAGFGDMSVLAFAEWEKLQRMIQLNVTALTYLTHRLLGGMLKRGKGGILNISSGFGLTFMPGFASYVGTKHYVTGFTESLRCEVQKQGIVVTQVCPGPVATEFESVAGNPTGRSFPKLVEISAEQCARESLRGFYRGRALVKPGFVMRFVMFLGAISPRFTMRLPLYGVGKVLHKIQEKNRSTKDL